MPDNVLRVPTWPNHTYVPATHFARQQPGCRGDRYAPGPCVTGASGSGTRVLTGVGPHLCSAWKHEAALTVLLSQPRCPNPSLYPLRQNVSAAVNRRGVGSIGDSNESLLETSPTCVEGVLCPVWSREARPRNPERIGDDSELACLATIHDIPTRHNRK